MATLIIPKKEYEELKRQADFYKALLRSAPDGVFGVEEYTDTRMQDFLKEDRIDKKTQKKVKRLLSARK